MSMDVFDLADSSLAERECTDCSLPVRYTSLHHLLGHDMLSRLLQLNAFMVSAVVWLCGAVEKGRTA